MNDVRCAIVALSTSSIDYFQVPKELPLSVQRLRLHLMGRNYLDGRELRPDTFYETLLNHRSANPTTSPPTVAEFTRTITLLRKKNFQEVLILTLAESLSRSYSIVQETIKKLPYNDIKVVAYDTGTCSVPEGVFAYQAARMASRGESIENITKTLDRMKEDTEIVFCINDLTYLVRSGKLTPTKNMLAKLLQIKPVISFKNGKIEMLDQVRGIDNAMVQVADRVQDRVRDPNLIPLGLYMGSQRTYHKMTDMLPTVLRFEYPLTPVVGAHIGPDASGIAFCTRIDKL